MGNNFSAQNNIYLQVDRPYYDCGDAVSGLVLLNCVSPFNCSGLQLVVEAHEKVFFLEERTRTHEHKNADGTTRHETEHYTVPHSARQVLFSVAIPLPNTIVGGCVQPGQFQFPFRFVTPMNVPGTLLFRSLRGGGRFKDITASIKFRIRAMAMVPGVFKFNIRNKTYLQIHQKLLKPPTEVLAQNSQAVTKCCCCGQGHVSLTAQIQKDSYMPGEMACVVLQADNKSEANFSKITISLVSDILLNTMTASCRLEPRVVETSYPGVMANDSFMGDKARLLKLQLPLMVNDMLPNTLGRIINVQNYLVVTLHASAFITNVVLKVPIQIYNPPSQQQIFTQPPPFWHPTFVGQVVNVPLPGMASPVPPIQQPPIDYHQPPQAPQPIPTPGYPQGYAAPPPGQHYGAPQTQPGPAYGYPQPDAKIPNAPGPYGY